MGRAVIRAALALAATLAALPAAAHQLAVFAWVDGPEVVVEGKFSNGRRPTQGTIRVFDADERVIRELPLGPDGTVRFPLAGGEDGLMIRLETGEGHEGSWILTPADLAGDARD
jgi:nickel transport protein